MKLHCHEDRRRVRAIRAAVCAVAGVATAAATMSVLATPAMASPPALTTQGSAPDVGALPVDSSISRTPEPAFPAAPRSGSGCAFKDVTGPDGLAIKHVAPCGSADGTGSASSPWRTIAQALDLLRPGQVAYVHDDPNRDVDYRESNLRPARSGSGATGRIWLVAAPGEHPWLARSSADDGNRPILHLNQAWWVVQGLGFDGNGLKLQTAVLRVGTAGATSVHHVVLRRLSSRNSQVAKAVIEFDGARNSALLHSRKAAGSGSSGLTEPLDADGRPRHVPATGDFTDHHAITTKNGADRILIENNESQGHNGDSFQCGEEEDTSRPVTSNITLVRNRFHQDEENAIDLKACQGVTLRANKLFGYRPARPYAPDGTLTSRAPQGDAIVVHSAASGRAADRVLIELNRFWDNSRGINISDVVRQAVVRRNLVFQATAAHCGMGAGLNIRARDAEVYHNTLDRLQPPARSPEACGPRFSWTTEQRSAIALDAPASSRSVLWNNIVSNATHPYHRTAGLPVDFRTNLVRQDPRYIDTPALNDYFTRQGSPARDRATPVPLAVSDPVDYCDDPSSGETDKVAEPDIGFLESCF
jgi:hypothetical protein